MRPCPLLAVSAVLQCSSLCYPPPSSCSFPPVSQTVLFGPLFCSPVDESILDNPEISCVWWQLHYCTVTGVLGRPHYNVILNVWIHNRTGGGSLIFFLPQIPPKSPPHPPPLCYQILPVSTPTTVLS